MNLKINFLGVDVIVEGDYQPEEKQTFDYPGADSNFTVYKVTTVSGDDLTELFDADLYKVRCTFDRTTIPRTVVKTVGSSMMDLIVEYCLEKIDDMADDFDTD